MTVSSPINVKSYNGNGADVLFAIPFFFIEDADIEVTLRTDATGAETTWVLNTDFTLTGAGIEAGGELTATTAPASGTTLFIRRVEQFTQGSDFPAAGAIPSNTIEQALDRLTFLCQQLNETFARSLTVPVTDAATSLVLPSNIDRASKFLAFDATGNPVAAAGTSANLGPVSAFMDTLLDDADAAAAQATLGLSNTAKTNAAQAFTKAQRGTPVTLTDAATIAVDFSLANNYDVTLAGNRTLGNPTNIVAGQSGSIVIKQDATGSRTLAYGSFWKFPGSATPTLTTTASARDRLDYYVESPTLIHASVALGIG